MKSFFFLMMVLAVISGCSKKFYVTQKPIQFDSTRRRLTLRYENEHYGLTKDTPTITPKMIVVHWTDILSFKKTFDVFDPPTLGGSRPDLSSGGSSLNVSAHYLIDRQGHIAQLLPDTVMARHVIGLNYCAIGIENVGSKKEPLTKAQLNTNAWLIRKLSAKYDIQYLIGHYEYRRFEGNPLWKEKDKNYRTEKIDPGIDFMAKLRLKLKDLDLKGPPK